MTRKKESGDFDKPISETRVSREECGSNGRNLNKKRSYAQFHLELGQSDFLLHACQSTKRSGTFQPSFKITCSLRTFTCFERSRFLWWHPLVCNTARLLCFSMFGTRKSPLA
ncbi:hypothetical protein ERO13_D05G345901v2 [Gossypium hirsutum]|nr:hypothetical protein ERO13_D05G345901v2 [Gossypium hirsutum]